MHSMIGFGSVIGVNRRATKVVPRSQFKNALIVAQNLQELNTLILSRVLISTIKDYDNNINCLLKNIKELVDGVAPSVIFVLTPAESCDSEFYGSTSHLLRSVNRDIPRYGMIWGATSNNDYLSAMTSWFDHVLYIGGEPNDYFTQLFGTKNISALLLNPPLALKSIIDSQAASLIPLAPSRMQGQSGPPIFRRRICIIIPTQQQIDNLIIIKEIVRYFKKNGPLQIHFVQINDQHEPYDHESLANTLFESGIDDTDEMYDYSFDASSFDIMRALFSQVEYVISSDTIHTGIAVECMTRVLALHDNRHMCLPSSVVNVIYLVDGYEHKQLISLSNIPKNTIRESIISFKEKQQELLRVEISRIFITNKRRNIYFSPLSTIHGQNISYADMHKNILIGIQSILQTSHDYEPIGITELQDWYYNSTTRVKLINLALDVYVDIARIITLCAMKTITHDSVWGLAANLVHINDAITERRPVNLVEALIMDIQASGYFDAIEIPVFTALSENSYPLVLVDPHVTDLYKGIHRSGWNYALMGMYRIDARMVDISLDSNNDHIIVDTFIDRTFHWGQRVLSSFGVLPFIKPWIGVLHHTFDTTFSPYNSTALFENPLFVQSLQTCKCIITLTNDMREKVKSKLEHIGVSHVLVRTITHPTETNVPVFSMEMFRSNKNRKLVQIGAWMRDAYAIYNLNLADKSNLSANPWELTRAVLAGINMTNHIKPPGFLDDFVRWIDDYNTNLPLSGVGDICRSFPLQQAPNKYVSGFKGSVVKDDTSVEIINTLDMNGYDDLLSKNIVFIYLYDCAAVNTIIECIVRSTPVIVNRLPALEEVLGAKYPGFYNDISEATLLLADKKSIEGIHNYLTQLDKTKFKLEMFMRSLVNIINNISK